MHEVIGKMINSSTTFKSFKRYTFKWAGFYSCVWIIRDMFSLEIDLTGLLFLIDFRSAISLKYVLLCRYDQDMATFYASLLQK